MHLGKAAHVVIILVVLLQVTAPANGGLGREVYRKFLTILHGEFTWPWLKWFKKLPTGPVYHSCQLCPWGHCNPVIKMVMAPPFSADADVISLTNVMVGRSPDDNLLTKILINRSELEREAIMRVYLERNNAELNADIMSKFRDSPLYQTLMTVLATPLPLFFAQQFAIAMNVQNTPDRSEMGRKYIIELLTSLPRCLIVKVMEHYQGMTHSDLITDLNRALQKQPSEYRSVVEKLVKEKRDQNMHTYWHKAVVDAFKLKKAIESNHVIKIYKRFSEIFTKRSFPQVVETMKVYENLRHDDKEFQSLFQDITEHLGKCKEVYELMVRILTNKPLYFATELDKILKLDGRKFQLEDGIQFITIIRGRLNIDLQDIIDAYNQQSKKGLNKAINSWATGPEYESFRDALEWIIT